MKREKKAKERPKFDIVFVPVHVPGDPIETIINAIEPNVNAVLKKHGAFLTIPLRDFIREHAIPHKDDQE